MSTQLARTRLSCLRTSVLSVHPVGLSLSRQIRSPSYHKLHSALNSHPGLSVISSRSFSLWPRSTPPPSEALPEPAAAESTLPIPEEASVSSADAAIPPTPQPGLHDLSSALPEGVDPSAPVGLLSPEVVDAAINVTNSIPPPLHYGDLAALDLISWTPAGLARWSFELLNVSTGMNWFWTIVAGTLFWRVALLPVAVKTYQFSSRMVLVQPQMNQIVERLKEAQLKQDVMEMQLIRAEQLKVYRSLGINPLQGMLGPVVQLPVAIGMFFGIKKMCELPVVQLTHSGLSWLPDLTVADPTGLMAPAFAVTMFWQMTVTARDMDVESRPAMAHVMNLMRFPGAPFFALFMSNLPSGLLVSIIVAAIATSVQSLIFRIPAVRRYFNILPLPQIKGRKGLPSYMDTYKWIRSSWRQRIEQARADQQQQIKNRRGSGTRRL